MKKRYEKPGIRKVKLVPSEAVLQACKTSGTTGPEPSFGCILDRIEPCSTLGS